ncbi:MAG: transcription termination/antitermination protein NusG [Pirellulales bacterium]
MVSDNSANSEFSDDAEPVGPGASSAGGDESSNGDVSSSEAVSQRDLDASSQVGDDDADLDEALDAVPEDDGPVEPIEYVEEPEQADADREWYILKVQVNREDSIRDALLRRVRIAGLERFFGEIIVPTEDVAEFNKNGKRRIVKKKLYPGYLLVHMALNDETWFVVRETSGIGDFTGSAGKPSVMPAHEVEKILRAMKPQDDGAGQVRTAIPFKVADRVRVKEGYFLNFEGEISAIDQAHGRVTVMINIFGRPNPVELDHWQIEAV